MTGEPGATVVVSGASGLVGRALCANLQANGYQVKRLVRREPKTDAEIRWSVSESQLDPRQLEGTSAIVHLSGESVAAGRWTDSQKRRIRDSRIQSTRLLRGAVAAMQTRPKTLVCASAVGIYGDRGDELLDENSETGSGFLADVCREWEAEASAVEELGLRRVSTRFGVVLAQGGGALDKLLPVFKLGGGGRLGSGKQFMPLVSLDDTVRAIVFALKNSDVHGPVNVVTPVAATNAEFTAALAQALNRPAIVPIPAFAISAIFGQMGRETLLGSQRLKPRVLQSHGFEFAHQDVARVIAAALNT